MRSMRLAAMMAAGLAIGALGASPATAGPARPAQTSSITITAQVIDQECQPNGDFVDVTLSATAQSSSEVVGYKWDFNNDRRWDTRALTDPTIVHRYPDEVSVTARVGAKNADREKAEDTVTFATLRCP